MHMKTHRHLIVQCSEVPHWMFIDWISQMLPLMDKPEGEAVEGILYSISVDYPQVEIPTNAMLNSYYYKHFLGHLLPLQNQYE